MYNAGDDNITFSFNKIIVLPEELVKATRLLEGKGLIVTHNKSEDMQLVKWTYEDGLQIATDDGKRSSISMVQVVSDMKRTSEVYNAEGSIRHYYIYDHLLTRVIHTPMQMAELIETENIKLLEES